MIVKFLREALGRLIVLIDWVTRPRKQQRTAELQAQISEQVQGLSLYQFYACPFCVKTRRTMHRLNLPIETRDAQAGSPFRSELETQGGRIKVPCLRIEEDNTVRWMYDSKDIIHYLENRFA